MEKLFPRGMGQRILASMERMGMDGLERQLGDGRPLLKSNKFKSHKTLFYQTTTILMNTYLYLMIKNDDW